MTDPVLTDHGRSNLKRTGNTLRIAVIDNRDSFVFNLVRYLEELGAECAIFDNDVETRALAGFDGVMISPGPGRPEDAGNSMTIIGWAYQNTRPLLGVCLGHQAIATYFGGKVASAKHLIHGGTSRIEHDKRGLFQEIPQNFRVARYHSLAVEKIPDDLMITARSDDGEIMALKHKNAPIVGLQFHPESILTEHGHHLLRNWLEGIRL